MQFDYQSVNSESQMRAGKSPGASLRGFCLRFSGPDMACQTTPMVTPSDLSVNAKNLQRIRFVLELVS